MTRLIAITVLMLGSLLPVGSAGEDSHASVEAESYRAEFEAWKSERITRLRAEDGWLSLAGLLWLQEGENSFGSAAGNTILFPEPAPAHVGVFTLREGKISLVVAAGAEVFDRDAERGLVPVRSRSTRVCPPVTPKRSSWGHSAFIQSSVREDSPSD